MITNDALTRSILKLQIDRSVLTEKLRDRERGERGGGAQWGGRARTHVGCDWPPRRAARPQGSLTFARPRRNSIPGGPDAAFALGV